MKKKLVAALLTPVFVLGGLATPSFASGLDASNAKEMYAAKGSFMPSPTNGIIQPGRDNVDNALGNNDSTFYSIGNSKFSKFTFAEKFYNVDNGSDIKFSEVTWSSWHEEAVEVYLVNPVVINCAGVEEAYTRNDLIRSQDKDGMTVEDADKEMLGNDNLYFAGVAFNKMVEKNNHVDNYTQYEIDKFDKLTGDWYDGTRNFVTNKIKTEGDIEITEFNIPENVVSAQGIVLVDITGKVNKEFYNDASLADDDGFDLASIRVYGKGETVGDSIGGDTSTGGGSTGNENGPTEVEKTTFITAGELRNASEVTRNIVLENGDIAGTYTLTLNDNKKKFRLTYELEGGYKLTDERYGVSFNSLEDAKNEENSVKINKSITIEDLLDGDNIYISISDYVVAK